jgi:hypothetical protein
MHGFDPRKRKCGLSGLLAHWLASAWSYQWSKKLRAQFVAEHIGEGGPDVLRETVLRFSG